MKHTATVHIDGGSRGNPGPAAYAVVLSRDGQPTIEEAQTIGTATNNIAEYTGLVRALELVADLGIEDVIVNSDSELLVKQMNGEYRVKNPDLAELYRKATELRRQLSSVVLQHVRRESNKRADFLCNEALDGRPRQRGVAVDVSPTAAPQFKKPKETVTDDRVRADALDCLRSAAHSWSQNGPNQPDVALVWDQLWSILAESGLLKKL